MELLADWPCAKGSEITSDYFEDIRKMLWGFNRAGYGVIGGVYTHKSDGELNMKIWSEDKTYHARKCCGTNDYWKQVVYLHPQLKEYIPYANSSHVSPGEPPPPYNEKWKRLARADVYCDWFKTETTYIFAWTSYTGGGELIHGLQYYRAYLALPFCLDKYAQAKVIIGDDKWQSEKRYHFGDIIKKTTAEIAKRFWCRVPHLATSAAATNEWSIESVYHKGAKVLYRDKSYVAVRAVAANMMPPNKSYRWLRMAARDDGDVWHQGTREYKDGESIAAGELYGTYQEYPVELAYNYVTGLIGPRYPWSTYPAIPLTFCYFIAGGHPISSNTRDEDMKFGYHYQSSVEHFIDYKGFGPGLAVFKFVNPNYDAGGTALQQRQFVYGNDEIWKCNQSTFEKCLNDIGHYDWYLDIRHQPQTVNDHVDGYILGTWRRCWKHSFGYPEVLAYYAPELDDEGNEIPGTTAVWPLVWPYEKGPPPYQNLCVKTDHYDYEFWRNEDNVWKAYIEAIGKLTPEDRMLVRERHAKKTYQAAEGEVGYYQCHHDILNDMKACLELLTLVQGPGFSWHMYQASYSSGVGIFDDFPSCAKAVWEAKYNGRAPIGEGTWSDMGRLGTKYLGCSLIMHGIQSYSPTVAKFRVGAATTFAKTDFYAIGIEVYATEQEIDNWVRGNASISFRARYHGSNYLDDRESLLAGSYPSVTMSGCTPNSVKKEYIWDYEDISCPVPAFSGEVNSNVEYNTMGIFTIGNPIKINAGLVMFFAEPDTLKALKLISCPIVRPFEPYPAGCPITQTELNELVERDGLIIFDEFFYMDTAIAGSWDQPLGCTPIG